MKKKVLALVGPTAVGKTEYALRLAQDLDGEIISADSVQIYDHMIIGSAKPSDEELALIKHHMIGNISPFDEFTVANYKAMAEKAIGEVFEKDKLAIVSGGTGLYLNALIYEMDFNLSPVNPQLREKLEDFLKAHGPVALHEKLSDLDPEAGVRIHPNNTKRVIRAIEIVESTGRTMADFENLARKNPNYDLVLVCLNRDRKELYNRINQRVDLMMEKGLLDEVKGLWDMGLRERHTSMAAIGYKELLAHLNGHLTLEESIDKIKQNSRNYAKRQLTWFRRYQDMHWFDLKKPEIEEEIVEAIKELVL